MQIFFDISHLYNMIFLSGEYKQLYETCIIIVMYYITFIMQYVVDPCITNNQ